MVGTVVFSGTLIVTVRLWGFCPVSRPSRLARPWTWGPLSEMVTANWSAAVLPGLAT